MNRWLLIVALVPVVLAAYLVIASAVGYWLKRSGDPLADAREPMSEGYSEALAEWDRRCAEWEARQRYGE